MPVVIGQERLIQDRGHTRWRRLYVIALTLLIPVSVSADEETRDLEDFHDIEINIPHDVELVRSDIPWVKLEGNASAIKDIDTVVVNGKLRISQDDGWFSWGRNEDVHLSVGYTELEAVTINGSSETYAETLTGDDLSLAIAGSGDLEIDVLESKDVVISVMGSGNVEIQKLDTRDLSTKISGSGSIKILGSCETQEVNITGSGDYAAEEFKSLQADVTIRGSGDAEMWVENQLNIAITGSGDLVLYGDPSITKSVSGAGSLEQRTKPL